jgi:hypothetical protein
MRVLTVLFAFLLTCCAHCGQHVKSDGLGPEPEPVIRPQPSSLCGQACQHLEELGCEEGKPLPVEDGGVQSCSELCEYQSANGIDWKLACLTGVRTCEEIESVCNPAPQTN